MFVKSVIDTILLIVLLACVRVTLADFELNIVGGVSTSITEVPYQVAIGYFYNNGQFALFCGGSLLSPMKVLTAAHCVQSPADYPYIYVVAGYSSLAYPVQRSDARRAASIVFHEAYDNETILNDVAVITLSSPFTLSDTIKTITLSTDASHYNGGLRVRVSGWGKLSGSATSTPTSLQSGYTTTMSAASAKSFFGRWYDGWLAANGAVDACNGDSGGPLAYAFNGETYLLGIVSWGYDCGTYPGVYTRVGAYASWILTHAPDAIVSPATSSSPIFAPTTIAARPTPQPSPIPRPSPMPRPNPIPLGNPLPSNGPVSITGRCSSTSSVAFTYAAASSRSSEATKSFDGSETTAWFPSVYDPVPILYVEFKQATVCRIELHLSGTQPGDTATVVLSGGNTDIMISRISLGSITIVTIPSQYTAYTFYAVSVYFPKRTSPISVKEMSVSTDSSRSGRAIPPTISLNGLPITSMFVNFSGISESSSPPIRETEFMCSLNASTFKASVNGLINMNSNSSNTVNGSFIVTSFESPVDACSISFMSKVEGWFGLWIIHGDMINMVASSISPSIKVNLFGARVDGIMVMSNTTLEETDFEIRVTGNAAEHRGTGSDQFLPIARVETVDHDLQKPWLKFLFIGLAVLVAFIAMASITFLVIRKRRQNARDFQTRCENLRAPVENYYGKDVTLPPAPDSPYVYTITPQIEIDE